MEEINMELKQVGDLPDLTPKYEPVQIRVVMLDGLVCLNFSRPVDLVSLQPEQAKNLANDIHNRANRVLIEKRQQKSAERREKKTARHRH